MQSRRDEPRVLPTDSALRVFMRRLREIMAEPSDGQARLDKIVRQIAGLMVAEVCSIYLKRQDGSLELFATEGLKIAAVHNTRLKRGEASSGAAPSSTCRSTSRTPRATPPTPTGRRRARRSTTRCSRCRSSAAGARRAQSCRTRRARSTPTRTSRSCRPPRWSWPSTRLGRRRRRQRGHGVLAGPLRPRPRRADGGGHRARPRGGARAARRRRQAHRRRSGRGDGPPRRRPEAAQVRSRRDARARAPVRRRRAPRGARGLPHVRPRQGLGAAAARGRARRVDGGSGRRARAERNTRSHAAAERSLLAGAPARPRRPFRPSAAHPRRPRNGLDPAELPPDAILVARHMGPAELLDYDRTRLRGLVIEEGSAQSHVAIVARALASPRRPVERPHREGVGPATP